MTATFGGSGLMLNPGGHYVMGFTLSNPADYAASSGDIEFQVVSPPGLQGGAVWLNNENNFAALNTMVWDTWGDIGDLAFTAHFTVIPEPSAALLMVLGFACYISSCAGTKERRT